MRIISANLNGIRSAHNKGFHQWLARQRWWLVGIVALALVVFTVALWLTSTPQDPFTYEVF